MLDATYGISNRQQRILDTTLSGRTTVLEPNPFPYSCPPGITHYTLWSIKENLTEAEIEDFVQNWIARHSPSARSWNYDENPSRSIDLFHVHVYVLDTGDLEDDEATSEPPPKRQPSHAGPTCKGILR